jgi:hypothetical protein
VAHLRAPVALLVAVAACACACAPEEVDTDTSVPLACEVDQDGDGVDGCDPLGVVLDCDDTNPRAAPGFEEVPYDGVDNDCDGRDVLDIDGDGYPGVSHLFYTAAHPAAPWPEGLSELEDCWDAPHPRFPNVDPAVVYPGAPDAWYDGVDSNCDGADDFDRDRDGYASLARAEDYTGPLDATDCDDFSSWISPGQIGHDAVYDGIDQDCQRDNDYDADGDGFVSPVHRLAYLQYLDATGFDLPPWEEVEGDWLDWEVSNFTYDSGAPVPPNAVYPNAVDPPYNGIDEACDDIVGEQLVANDFDSDGDGVMVGGYEDAFVRYYLRYGSLAGPDGVYTPYKDAFRVFGSSDGDARLYYRTHSGDRDDADPLVW